MEQKIVNEAISFHGEMGIFRVQKKWKTKVTVWLDDWEKNKVITTKVTRRDEIVIQPNPSWGIILPLSG